MKPEIEAKFLSIDHDELRQKLEAVGAVCVKPLRTMRRRNYDFADDALEKVGGWVRVRDEGGGRTTMSYKQLNDRTLTGTYEVEIVVDDYGKTVAFLEAIGLELKSDQETKRESWRLGEVQIELDEWPWAKPYLEIEGPDEEAVEATAKSLGLDWARALHGSVEVVYQAEYDLTEKEINDTVEYRFESPVPELFASRKRKV